MTRTRTHVCRPAARLSAAVLGAGLAAPLALASPALAVEGEETRWSDDHGVMAGHFLQVNAESVTQAHFQTYSGYDPEDLTLTVAPADAAGEPVGDAVGVPFTPVELIDGGIVDVLETRRALGEAGTGPVVYEVYAGETRLQMSMAVGADDDLSDDRGGELLALVNPQDFSGLHPLVWDSEAALAPGVDSLRIQRIMPVIEESNAWIQEQPEHGELHTVRNKDTGRLEAWYIPEEGFVGTDAFTVDFHGDHAAGIETITVTVGEPLPAEVTGLPDAEDGVMGGEPLDLDDPHTAALLAAMREAADEPRPTPQPVEPQPAEPRPSAPGAEDADGGTAEEHAVPEKVETGDTAAWWLAGAAALGAGALMTARRRFGLAR